MTLPDSPHRHFDRLQRACAGLAPLATAVVCPDDANALGGALAAREAGLIEPLLVGDPQRIAAAAQAIGADLRAVEVVPVEGDQAATAVRAMALVAEGRARAVMKGNLHSDVLLSQVVKRGAGLRTARRLSHVFVCDVPGFDRLLHITDGALNIAPDLATRRDIALNAIELARACGADPVRIAVMSAIETVNPHMRSSVEAAEIVAMMTPDDLQGALIDGPFAMDNAVSEEAARIKGIRSPVAGHADVLLMPGIEAGNMVVKALTFVAGGETAGLVLGAKVPVMLTSRADSARARLLSCVLALLLEDYQRTGRVRT